ncbi:type III-B CRISPR module RAMP protein Cmr4 [bacterium]|nr:type III-B CRISPR module RAMP protein Cmr4 [bacterium]
MINNYIHALLTFHCITPLHVGCGQEVGVVDLPVIRERSTGHPFIPGSGIRGTLRDVFELQDTTLTRQLFGPDNGASNHAGCLAVHDAHLLLFPVRADKQVFCWITCPMVLQRWNRDIKAYGFKPDEWTCTSFVNLAEDKFVGPEEPLGKQLHLEEFCFDRFDRDAAQNNLAESLKTWADKVGQAVGLSSAKDRTCLVSDKAFYHFVNYATMLIQHNTLTTAKTVKDGALFSVESVPPEAVFYGLIGATQERKEPEEGEKRLQAMKVLEKFKQTLFVHDEKKTSASQTPIAEQQIAKTSPAFLQFGGDEGTGLGVTKLTWLTVEEV